MNKLRRLARPISYIVTVGVLALSVHLPAVHAAVIGTEAVVSAQQAEFDRTRVQSLLGRAEIKQQLLAAGVDPSQVSERVDALNDNEVHQLAAKIDQLPAGGDALGVLVFVFIVLLITDILGFTDVFPFVKKPVRR
ncbi:MAG: hypothetical protein A2W18_09120 [Candidatus Muproteobacteria bacterium RBG_16_60_9]|uniref:PA2779 family protein n=1 Tax=Candidatus Muproteobacteria bacterium RBG_16_60_9 TaxID=1817755 RepID=A0A1F6V2A7_9PROT|nr:MAG: hypothetical protein A2W18_09120 [Candidatus Muproteobacteria bacterium RBG_16_60_9]